MDDGVGYVALHVRSLPVLPLPLLPFPLNIAPYTTHWSTLCAITNRVIPTGVATNARLEKPGTANAARNVSGIAKKSSLVRFVEESPTNTTS